MRSLAGLLLVCATGCSTSPVADFLDFAFPPRKVAPNAPCYGGVGAPQPAPPVLGVPQPSNGVVPPPAVELPGIPVPDSSRARP